MAPPPSPRTARPPGTPLPASTSGARAAAVLARHRGVEAILRPPPLELLAVNPMPADLPGAAAPPAAAEVDAGPAVRSRLPALASAVSYMATGALVAVLGMWGGGLLDPVVVDLAGAEAAEPPTRADLPRTGAEAAARPDPLAAPAPAPAQAATATTPQRTTGPAYPQVANPVQIEIPAIGVSSRVIPLATQADGSLEVPQDFAQTGWWTGGAEPGELGPAVVAGHVDSFQGPAVFFDLQQLQYDDAITITRVDGSQAVFAVREMLQVDKAEFPTELVYGPTDAPELRLVTCDGDFDGGSYLGNLIVTAELVDEVPAPAPVGVTIS
jgi:hypothetical protein